MYALTTRNAQQWFVYISYIDVYQFELHSCFPGVNANFSYNLPEETRTNYLKCKTFDGLLFKVMYIGSTSKTTSTTIGINILFS